MKRRKCFRYLQKILATLLMGLALLLPLIPLVNHQCSFTGCILLWLLSIFFNLWFIYQQQRKIQQLTSYLQSQIDAEKLPQQKIAHVALTIAQGEQAQLHVTQQAVLFCDFLDALPDLCYCCNEHHQLLNCNQAMEQLTGKSRQQLMGLTPLDLYPEAIAQEDMETNQQLFHTNRAITYKQRLSYADGRQAYFEIHKIPLYDHTHQQRGILAFGRDISSYYDKVMALEQENCRKNHFIAMMSHELRTPISGIVGLSRLLQTEQPDKSLQQRRYLKTIYLCAVSINHILNDLVNVDKIERQEISLANEPLSLKDFLEELTDLGKILVEPKGLFFTLRLTKDLPSYILIDGTRLRQIMWNLLNNAVKFTSTGGIILQVQVSASKKKKLQLAVIDSGIGIAELEQPKIFTLYYRVTKESGTHNPMGLGIGLALSKQLALLMKGDLTVQSQPKQGSCFTLTIPLQLATPPNTELSPITTLMPIRVLLIEDVMTNITIAEAILKKVGCTVDIATSGQQALTCFAPHRYQLVLIDIQLPDMSGFEMAKQLRKTYPAELLPPLVALTAHCHINNNQCPSQEIDAYLQKPLLLQDIIQIIKKYLPEKYSQQTSTTDNLEHQTIVDKNLVKDYLILLGKSGFLQNIILLEQIIPDYLIALKEQLNTYQVTSLHKTAHKIQGACGSVGLQRLQQLAFKIQQSPLPNSWHSVAQWVNELSCQWQQDIEYLKNWIEKNYC